jgi:phosphoribosyl 1,2-cyclic phosphodiesterase
MKGTSMITIESLASSSKGNCYIIDDDGSSIMIEAGLPINKIKELTGHSLQKVKGCLVTHEHKDHSHAVPDMLANGIDCYMTSGTAHGIGIPKHHRLHIKKYRKPFVVDRWAVMMFEAKHDVREPCGFFLVSPHGSRILFLTDSAYCKYRFPLMNYIIIECNYSSMDEMNTAEMKRIVQNHMSLETLLDFLKANDLNQLKEIHLIHLSSRNSNADKIKREVASLTGVPVFVEDE